MPKDIRELLEWIERDWSALLQFLKTKDEAQQVHSNPGQWSIKDNLAHLAFWEKFLLLHHLQEMPVHLVLEIDPVRVRQLNIDQLNQIIHDRSQKSSLSEVLHELHQTHARLTARLEAVDFAALSKTDRIETLIERPLLESVLSNTCDHYQEHLKTMQREAADKPGK